MSKWSTGLAQALKEGRQWRNWTEGGFPLEDQVADSNKIIVKPVNPSVSNVYLLELFSKFADVTLFDRALENNILTLTYEHPSDVDRIMEKGRDDFWDVNRLVPYKEMKNKVKIAWDGLLKIRRLDPELERTSEACETDNDAGSSGEIDETTLSSNYRPRPAHLLPQPQRSHDQTWSQQVQPPPVYQPQAPLTWSYPPPISAPSGLLPPFWPPSLPDRPHASSPTGSGTMTSLQPVYVQRGSLSYHSNHQSLQLQQPWQQPPLPVRPAGLGQRLAGHDASQEFQEPSSILRSETRQDDALGVEVKYIPKNIVDFQVSYTFLKFGIIRKYIRNRSTETLVLVYERRHSVERLLRWVATDGYWYPEEWCKGHDNDNWRIWEKLSVRRLGQIDADGNAVGHIGSNTVVSPHGPSASNRKMATAPLHLTPTSAPEVAHSSSVTQVKPNTKKSLLLRLQDGAFPAREPVEAASSPRPGSPPHPVHPPAANPPSADFEAPLSADEPAMAFDGGSHGDAEKSIADSVDAGDAATDGQHTAAPFSQPVTQATADVDTAAVVTDTFRPQGADTPTVVSTPKASARPTTRGLSAVLDSPMIPETAILSRSAQPRTASVDELNPRSPKRARTRTPSARESPRYSRPDSLSVISAELVAERRKAHNLEQRIADIEVVGHISDLAYVPFVRAYAGHLSLDEREAYVAKLKKRMADAALELLEST